MSADLDLEEELARTPLQRATLKRLFGYAAPHRRALALVMALEAVWVVSMLVEPAVVRGLVDGPLQRQPDGSFAAGAAATAAVLLGVFVVNVVLRAITTRWELRTSTRVGVKVIDRLRQENVNVAGGTLEEGSIEYMVRTLNEFTAVEEIAETVVTRVDDRDIRVRDLGTVPLDGFIGPAHVSTIIGSRPYAFFAEEYRKPVVIAGFEPLDVMQAIRMLIRQVNEGRAEVENEFTRAVTDDGNLKAQALVSEVFELRRSFEWRGLHEVPYSALRIRAAFADWDAERKFGLAFQSVADNKACECGAILRGVKTPTDCKIFGTVCTPENPMGSCMVSSEGACAAHYNYGRFRDIPVVAEPSAAVS